ncbi:hypothetical protein GB937_007188 [Aspergillus fischeri]|nr:hypothetical protein GB937_007188 [Aspergillus fischeri]
MTESVSIGFGISLFLIRASAQGFIIARKETTHEDDSENSPSRGSKCILCKDKSHGAMKCDNPDAPFALSEVLRVQTQDHQE